MITLDEARENIGREVIYTNDHSNERDSGIITSVGTMLVFVRYRLDRHSKGTYPHDLEWASRDSG